MELGLEEFLVRQDSLVLRNQCRGEGAAHGVLHHLIVLTGAQQNAD